MSDVLDDMHTEFLLLCEMVFVGLQGTDHFMLIEADLEIEEEWLDGICATVAAERAKPIKGANGKVKAYRIGQEEILAVAADLPGVYIFQIERDELSYEWPRELRDF